MAKFLLISGRSLDQGIFKESYGKLSDRYLTAISTVYMNPEDIKELGIREGSYVEVSTNSGKIYGIVRADANIRRGLIFIPYGVFVNQLVDSETKGLGMPNFKEVVVEVKPVEKIERIEIPVKLIKELPGVGDIPLTSGEKKVFEDVVCTFCGLTCDSIVVEIEGNKIVNVKGACAIGMNKLRNYHSHRILKPMIREGETYKIVSLDEAITKAAEILVKAKYPLLYGWSCTSCEAIEVGVELAQELGGVIDNTATVCHGPTLLGVTETGIVSITLAYVRHFADLVILWGCNPKNAHVNFFLRFITPGGRKISGRKDRKIVIIDPKASEKDADLVLRIEPGKDYELVTALRMLIKDLEIEKDVIAGIPKEQVQKLADLIASSRYIVILVGLGITHTGAKFETLAEVMRLAQEINEFAKCVIIPMRGHFNVTGANMVTLWLTGYPYAVDFSRGFPKFIPGVTTAVDLLSRGEVDAMLVIGADPLTSFPKPAIEHMLKIPVIYIGPKDSLTAHIAQVIIPSALTGIEVEGSVYRLDKVPLRTKKLLEPPEGVLSDKEVLEKLLKKVKELKGKT